MKSVTLSATPSPILRRLLHGLGRLLLLLAFGASLHAQSFTLGAESLGIPAFETRSRTPHSIAIASTDPAFDPAALTVSNNSGGWLYSYVSADTRTLELQCAYGNGADAVATVTVRSATHTATLAVNRVGIAASAYRTPKALLSSDKTKLYALYQDTVLLLDARTGSVLARARLGLPPGFTFSPDSGRSFSFSEDESELRVFLSGCPILFRLSARDLSTVGSLALPPAGASGAHRVFAGEKDGALYFIRYGARTNPTDSYHETHYDSVIDVVALASGALRQSYRLPDADQISTLDDLAPHPHRAELWVRERRRVFYFSSKVWLRRLSLGPDGLIQEPLGEPLYLTDSMFSSTGPWTDNRARILLRRDAAMAMVDTTVFDAAAEPPVPLRTFTFSQMATHLSQGVIAAAPDRILRLDTGEWFSSETLDSPTGYFNPTIVGLSGDGQDVLLLSMNHDAYVPTVVFLPAALASLPASQVRVPADGQLVAPTGQLAWYSLPGADHYRVFLSTEAADLAVAEPAPDLLAGEPPAASLTLSAPLAAGATYFWRVDAVYGGRAVTGAIQSFSVSDARVAQQPFEVATVAGARRRDFSIPVSTASVDTAWQIISDTASITVRAGSGVGPGAAELSLDAVALAVGDTTVGLRLVTSAGTVPVSLKIQTLAPAIETMAVMPDEARCLAIGPAATVNGVREQLLLSIDASTEEIVRCVAIPGGTFSILSGARFFATGPSAPVYLPGHGSSLGEFDPASLELRRVVRLPKIGDRSVSVRAVRPAGDGRIWVLDTDHVLARLDASGSGYDLILPAQTAAQSYLSADATALYTFTRNGPGYSRSDSFTLRRYDLVDSALVPGVERTVAYPAAGYYYDAPAQGHAPDRFSYQGVVYDESLNPVSKFDGASLMLDESGAYAVSGALLHLGDDYSEAYILPSDTNQYGRRRYEPVSGKFITFESGLKFTPLAKLAAVLPTALTATRVSDIGASLAWERAPTLGVWSGSYLDYQLDYRPAGSVGPWTTRHSYYETVFTLPGLTPETVYEARARVSCHRGVLSDWSDTFTFKTAIARPAYTPASWPQALSINEGNGFYRLLHATGQELDWQVTGLPPGLTFNPATRVIQGAATEPGRYTVQITVANAGGSFTHSFSLHVAAAGLAKGYARYSGLQDFAYDPLVGDWRATRSGNVFTGYIRTFVGGGSFKVKLPVGPYDQDSVRYGSFKVRIADVNVPGTFKWDALIDKCALSLYFHDFGSTSLDYTGWGTSYDKLSLHPFAARYTGLSMSDPERPSGYPVPEGLGFLRLDLKPDGSVRLAAETALGQRFTTHTNISRDGLVPVFVPNHRYHLWGLLQIDQTLAPPHPRLAGYVNWTKYPHRKASAYRDGFDQTLLVFGAPLPATGKKLPPLAPLANDANRADFALSGGGLYRLSKPIVQSLTPAPSGFTAPKAGAPENPNRVAVKLDSRTGLVTGSAAILNATGSKVVRTQKFRGMFVKDPLGDGDDLIGGYFLLPDGTGVNRSGRLEITEPEEEPAP